MSEYKVEVYNNGVESWRNKEGKLHRENGPAVIWPGGTEGYWIDGKELTKEEFDARSDPMPKHEGQAVVVDGIEYELKAKGE